MNGKALVVIDIQNDITKHYRDIIHRLNSAIDWAAESGMEVLYIKHNNLSAGTRTFKPGTKGEELAPELKVVSDKVFVKTKASALTSESFSDHIRTSGITGRSYLPSPIQYLHWKFPNSLEKPCNPLHSAALRLPPARNNFLRNVPNNYNLQNRLF